MPKVPDGTLSCQVYGDTLMAMKFKIEITSNNKHVWTEYGDLCDRALDRLTAGIKRSLQPSKPRKGKGESDGGSPEPT